MGRVAGAVALLAWSLAPQQAEGQGLHGRLLDADSGQPVAGAMLVATDGGGRVLDRTLTDDDGRFVLRRGGAAGVARLRVVRIGYATQDYAAGDLQGETLELRVPSSPIELEGFGVVAENLCGDEFENSGQVYDIWLEVRKALEMTRFTETERVLGFAAEHIVSILDADDQRELEREVEPRQLLGEKPYYSLTAEEMTRKGWAEEDDNGDVVYYAPDVVALLSEEFSAQHCYGAEITDDRILLRFVPNSTREAVPELEGELVLDREGYALDHLRFTYTSLPLPAAAQGYAGGEVHFAVAPNGLWIVREWSIRVPLLSTRVEFVRSGVRERLTVRELREERGRVLRIHAGSEVLDVGPGNGP